jgi:hypothetical protein
VTRFITPNSDFFIRGHQGIPDRVDAETFRFRIFNDSSTILSLPPYKLILDENDDEDRLPLANFSLLEL